MPEEIFRHQVGRTPLVRAKKIENALGFNKIYLKLEGNNPSGHREDRLAYLIIRDAIARDKRTICMGTTGTTAGSLSYLADFYDVKLIFYIPDKDTLYRKKLVLGPHVEVREFGESYIDCVRRSREVAKENGWYDANPGLENNMMNMYAFSYIANELVHQTKNSIDTVFCQTSNGSSIAGLHMGLKELWVYETIQRLPRLVAVSTDHGNAIVETYKRSEPNIVELDPEEVDESEMNRNLVNLKCFNGQDALNALYDTYGAAIGVTDRELEQYYDEFQSYEDIILRRSNSYPIAALFKYARENAPQDGVYIVILNDGRVDIDVRVLDRADLGMPYEKFIQKLDDWLVQFSDPFDEIEEAVTNAFESGYVICAYDENILNGIAIISRSNFDTFFPRYHLSYIATKKDVKGRGIATQLIQKVIDTTGGDFSLHVETDNPRAIKLYEKMGLERKYFRMIYQES